MWRNSFFKKFFNKAINSVTLAAALVAVSSVLSRLLGIVRDRILAGKFGADIELDIYYTAFRIPDLLFNLVVLGAISAGFLPVFSSLINNKKKERKEAWLLASNIINSLVLSLTILSLLGIIFAPFLMKFIAPGFSNSERLAAAKLTRIMFLSPIFLGLSGVISSILQTFKRFIIYSLAPVFYNIGIIIGALVFVPLWGIVGLAWGVVLGAFLHFIIQVPSTLNLGFKYHKFLSWQDKNIKRIARITIPRTLSLAVAQINLVVITIIASTLPSGSLTAFNFANNLQSFPIGIFGISFAIAAFPAFVENVNNPQKLGAYFSSAVRQILFFIIPSTIVMISLRAQIIRIIFGTGNFDWRSTIMTMNALGFFSLSLFAQAIIPVLTRVYYAKENSITPFYFGLASIIINIILSFSLAPNLGVSGLALAFSISNIINLILLWAWLYVKIGSLDLKNILIATLKFIIASLAAGVAIQVMKVVIWPYIDMNTFKGVFIQLFGSALVALIVYFLMCYLLRSIEFIEFLKLSKQKLSFKKVKLGDQGEVQKL